MAIEDLKPEGFSESDQRFARFNLGSRVFVQGMGKNPEGEQLVAVWLELGCGSRAMIGFGDYQAAKCEATSKLMDLGDTVNQKVHEFAGHKASVPPTEGRTLKGKTNE